MDERDGDIVTRVMYKEMIQGQHIGIDTLPSLMSVYHASIVSMCGCNSGISSLITFQIFRGSMLK